MNPQLDLEAMQREVSDTRRLCEAIASPVVFAHNDLLSGNILVLQVRAHNLYGQLYGCVFMADAVGVRTWSCGCVRLPKPMQSAVASPNRSTCALHTWADTPLAGLLRAGQF
jgi:hypothetical protein